MRKLQITNYELRINGESIKSSAVNAAKKSRVVSIVVLIAIMFVFSVSQAQAVNNPFSVSALNSAVLKAGTNSLNKRLGDLRRTEEEVTSAVWMRGYYNELSKYGGIDLDANISGVEAGVDFRILKDSPNRTYIGVLAGYVGAENFDQANNVKSGAPLIGLYKTWLNPDGWFIDAVARYFFYSAQDVVSGQETDFGMFAVNVEGGKEFKFPTNASNFFMVEPKIKGTFGHIGGATLNSVKYDSANTFIVRPAVFAGYSATLNNGAIVEPYIEGGYNQDLSSDMKISGYDSRGISGGSFDIGGGFNAIVTKILSIYTYAGYEKGDKIENLSVNAGFRIALTRAKRTENYDKKKEEKAEVKAGEKSDTERNNVTDVNEVNSAEASNESSASQTESGNKGAEAAEILQDNRETVSKNEQDSGIDSGEEMWSIHMRNVHFAFDKYNITPEYAEFLKKEVVNKIKNSKRQIEIDGHTDRIGTEEYNQGLSERRAKAVYDKLIELGVPANKLTYKGFSFNRMINLEETPEADAENRRVEIHTVE